MGRVPGSLRRTLRLAVPGLCLAAGASARIPVKGRVAAGAGLVASWSLVYASYRRWGVKETAKERTLLYTATPEAYSQHYNLRVPTTEEELDLWGDYHRHRHEMRYDLVAAQVRRHLAKGETVLDLGCGAAMVADRIRDVEAHYVGLDYGGRHIAYAAKKYADTSYPLTTSFVRGDGERLPFADASFDVIAFSEVIEHLVRPELAVWEISRVLKPGGVLVLTTNNASQMPCRSPLSHALLWLEKMAGVRWPSAISYRPWVWPEALDPAILPPGTPPTYLPHTWHILSETIRMLGAAGLQPEQRSTFEFPPPESRTAGVLGRWDEPGRKLVDAIEWACRSTPGVRWLGAHLLLVMCKTRAPQSDSPPAGIWPGPFSE
jgi:ubiquinone/menaquinone biosynthesis C-methylase UbiE